MMDLLSRLRPPVIIGAAFVVLVVEFSLFSGDNLVADWLKLLTSGLGAFAR